MTRWLNNSFLNKMNRLRSFPSANLASQQRSTALSYRRPPKKDPINVISIPDPRHLVRARRTSTAGLIEALIKESLLVQMHVDHMKANFGNTSMPLTPAAAVVAVMVAVVNVVGITDIVPTELPASDRMICDRARKDSSISGRSTCNRTKTDSTTKAPTWHLA